MRLYVCLLAVLLCANAASAQDRFPLMARAGLGAGYATVSAEAGYQSPTSHGAGLLWDAALGVFVTRWLALHGSAFGSVHPRSRPSNSCVDDCGPEKRETVWAQTYGAGLTTTPSHGLGRSGLRPFFSASAGLAIISAPLSSGVAGAGAQVLFGLEYELSRSLRVGLGIQGMFEGKKSLQLATEDGFKFWQGGGIITVSYDRR